MTELWGTSELVWLHFLDLRIYSEKNHGVQPGWRWKKTTCQFDLDLDRPRPQFSPTFGLTKCGKPNHKPPGTHTHTHTHIYIYIYIYVDI